MPEATSTPQTIVLIGELEEYQEEYPADAALKPGHLVLEISTGKVKKNDAASVPCRKLFAKEDDHIGRTIADAYAADEVVFCHSAQPGNVIYAWVPASATALVKGDKVKSNGDGCLVKITASTDFVVGTVHEAVDNSGGGSEARLKVRIN